MDLKHVRCRLNCKLCTNIYRCPKYFRECGHVFCESCIRRHILRTVPEDGQSIRDYYKGNVQHLSTTRRSFKCPLENCGTEIKPYDSNVPPSCWVYQLFNDLNTLTLVELCTTKRNGGKWLCANCGSMSVEVSASHACLYHRELYCNKCAFVHVQVYKNDPNCNLETVPLTDIQGCLLQKHETPDQDGDICADSFVLLHRDFCKIHPAWEIKYSCLKCKEDFCVKCSHKKHAKQRCEISLILPDTAESHLDKLRNRLHTALSDLSQTFEAEKEELRHINKLLNSQQNAISHKTDKAVDESKVVVEIGDGTSTFCNERLSGLEMQVERWGFLKSHIENLLAKNGGTTEQMARSLQLLEEDTEQCEEEILHKNKKYKLNRDKNIQHFTRLEQASLQMSTNLDS